MLYLFIRRDKKSDLPWAVLRFDEDGSREVTYAAGIQATGVSLKSVHVNADEYGGGFRLQCRGRFVGLNDQQIAVIESE